MSPIPTNLLCLSYHKCLQKIFNYAGPVLVSIETVRTLTSSRRMGSDKVWYYVLETTRILLAHCSIVTSENRQLLAIIAHNIRNLYRLFGMDLAEKKKWRNIVLDTMYYVEPNHKGNIYLSINNPTILATELQFTSFAIVVAEFEGEDRDLKQYIGHCIYNLVGKREESWRRSMHTYATLDI